MRYRDGDGRVFLNRNKQPYDLILCDAFHGGYIPFHLLTREFFRLVKQQPDAERRGRRSTSMTAPSCSSRRIVTMRAEFPSLHLYPTGEGEVIAVGMMQPRDDKDALARRAAEMQEKFKFRYPLPEADGAARRQCRRLAGRDADRRFRAGRSLQRAAQYAGEEEAVAAAACTTARCVPAKAGDPAQEDWIPAFAGMSGVCGFGFVTASPAPCADRRSDRSCPCRSSWRRRQSPSAA